MTFFSALGGHIAGFFSLLWFLLVIWLSLFIAPFRNPELLWVIVPIWLAWFFTEFFQEKRSTSFGNAVSNGIVPLWVSIDWTRLLVERVSGENLGFSWPLLLKFGICLLVFTYGTLIIIAGIKVRKFVPYIARIREVTYVLLVFTPVIYGVIDVNWKTLAVIVIFFPLYYFIIELLDYVIPDPDTIKEDLGKSDDQLDDLDFSFSQPSTPSFGPPVQPLQQGPLQRIDMPSRPIGRQHPPRTF